MGNVISASLSEKVNKNWSQLECSYLGGPLQSMGIAPGDPTKTNEKCQSQQFNSFFSKNMGGAMGSLNLIDSTIGVIKKDMMKFKDVINSIKTQVGKDIAGIASKFFDLYKRIIRIVFVFMKHLNNIMRIFRDSFNVLFGFYWIFASLLNLLTTPINAIAGLVELFGRKGKYNPFAFTIKGHNSIMTSSMKNLPPAILKQVDKKLVEPIRKPFDKIRRELRKIGIKV